MSATAAASSPAGLAAAEHPAPGSSRTPVAALGAELASHYDEAFRLVAPSAPDAFVEVQPVGGASHAPARLRHDGALVAYDDAYPRVSAAVGASDDRVETKLRVASAAGAPALRYRLKVGPAFGRWEGDEAGARWAYDNEGRGLFRFAPPSVRDAHGNVIEGRWRVRDERGEAVVEAELPWAELAFPVLASVSFETPTWFPAAGATTPAPRHSAGLTFYGGDQNCAVLFGGIDYTPTGAARYRDDVAVRCGGQWQVGTGIAGIDVGSVKPTARRNAPLAYAFDDTANAGAYLFGGLGPGVRDDFWRLTLSTGANGVRTGTWTPLPKTAGNWPPARMEAGLVATSAGLLLFGGANAGGFALDDTWLFDGSAWTRICQGAGCFPARRNPVPFVIGAGTSAKVAAFGGTAFVSGAFVDHDELYTFTGSGWQRETRDTSAAWPTLLDGQIASGGEVRPSPRASAWAAPTASGHVLLGSGGTSTPGNTDPLDVWRLEASSGQPRWGRVPVTTSLPGRRIGGSAVYDPVRQETLVVGGVSFVAPDFSSATLNPSPPVAYRAQPTTGALRVTCHDPDDDFECNTYTLEAQVTLPGDAPPSRARAVFTRQTGTTWAPVGAPCGLPGSPIAPQGDGVFRCEVTASFGDASFAVQLQDASYATGGSLCSSTPNDTLPFCNHAGLYAGVVACRQLPFGDGASVDCE